MLTLKVKIWCGIYGKSGSKQRLYEGDPLQLINKPRCCIKDQEVISLWQCILYIWGNISWTLYLWGPGHVPALKSGPDDLWVRSGNQQVWLWPQKALGICGQELCVILLLFLPRVYCYIITNNDDEIFSTDRPTKVDIEAPPPVA